jgi:hypothetical protein
LPAAAPGTSPADSSGGHGYIEVVSRTFASLLPRAKGHAAKMLKSAKSTMQLHSDHCVFDYAGAGLRHPPQHLQVAGNACGCCRHKAAPSAALGRPNPQLKLQAIE